jgi:hypothetical protein
VNERRPDATASYEVGRRGDRAKVEAALRNLSECVDRIQALIPELQTAIDRRADMAPPRRGKAARIVYGGGASAFASSERTPADHASAHAASPDDLPTGSTRHGRRSGRDVFLAAELAFAGYSRDDIGAHLRARRGPGAEPTVADAFDQ